MREEEEKDDTVKFCSKYKPLFELLQARGFVGSEQFNKLSEDRKEYWRSLVGVDVVVMTGGRDSGKTFVLSSFAPIACKDYNHRILYTRYTMASTDQSIIEAVKSRLELFNITSDFKVNKQEIRPYDSEGKIIFTGIKTASGQQSAKLKSLEGFSMFIGDEAEEFPSYDEWDKVKKSIRAKDVQNINIICMNPATTEHWIYEEFFKDRNVEAGFNGVVENVLYIHTSYLDMDESHIAPNNLREYRELEDCYNIYINTKKEERDNLPKKIIKKAKYYKYAILGGWRNKAEGVIYEDWEIGEFDDSLPFCYGLDFGYKDPLAFIKVAVDEKKKLMYLDEVIYKSGVKDVVSQLKKLEIDKDSLIVCDTNETTTTVRILEAGYNIRKAKKGKGSVVAGIRDLNNYTLIVTPKSVNIKRELNNYVWLDKKGDVPSGEFNHALDATKYGKQGLDYRAANNSDLFY